MPGRKPLVRLFNNIVAFPVLLTLVIVYVNLEQEDTFMKLNNSISCFITVCVCVYSINYMLLLVYMEIICSL